MLNLPLLFKLRFIKLFSQKFSPIVKQAFQYKTQKSKDNMRVS
jgi:hypothetical protein